MTPSPEMLVAMAVSFAGGAVCMMLATMESGCEDCRSRDVELGRLQASNASLLHQRDTLLAVNKRQALLLDDICMDNAENEAMRRELEAWKRDMDPRIANMSPEQIDKLLHDIFEPVRPSPASFATIEELIGAGPVGEENDQP